MRVKLGTCTKEHTLNHQPTNLLKIQPRHSLNRLKFSDNSLNFIESVLDFTKISLKIYLSILCVHNISIAVKETSSFLQ